ncbi:hypothetical protein [Streptomyces platensis]|uniref:hypothetical protein n=1 Tax=Streptomyces platensis TaxID=58346 RepID=UPI0037BDB40E
MLNPRHSGMGGLAKARPVMQDDTVPSSERAQQSPASVVLGSPQNLKIALITRRQPESI